MRTHELVLGHLDLIEEATAHLKQGIEYAMTIQGGAIIHKAHALEILQHIEISAWAAKDLLEHPGEGEEGKEGAHGA